MTINLFVLIDKYGRVLYTGHNESHIESVREKVFSHLEDLKVVELKGEFDNESSL